MKKIISILFCFALISVSLAQNKVYNFAGLSGSHAIKDSVSNTGADTMKLQAQHYSKTVSIQPVITKVSGTIPVLATCVLQGSLDGTNYLSIPGDSVHLSDVATSTGVFVIKNSPYQYFRLITTGSGTMKVYVKCFLMPNAQSGGTGLLYSMKSTTWTSVTKDTVTNSGTNSVTLQVQNWYETLSIQPIVTKLSGTAGGTVTLQGSNDGTNFVTVNTKYLSTLDPYFTSGAAATLSITNTTTNTGIFVILGSPYQYYRLSYTGSGTMSCTLQGKLFATK